MSDTLKTTPLTPKGGWPRKKDSAIDTIRNSAASGEWTDTSTLTPAEATARCEAVADLVAKAKHLLFVCEKNGLSNDVVAEFFSDNRDKSGNRLGDAAKESRRAMNETRATLASFTTPRGSP